MNRNITITSIKRFINPNLHNKCFSFYSSSRTLGAFLGGILIFSLTKNIIFEQTLNINLIFNIISLIMYICFLLFRLDKYYDSKQEKDLLKYSFLDFIKDIFKHTKQLVNLSYYLISSTFFLGFHHVSRIFIPYKFESNSSKYISLFQVISSIAVIIGSIFITLKFNISTFRVNLACVINSIIILIIGYINNIFIILLLYFIFIFLHQVVYSKSISDILCSTPQKKIGYTITFINLLSMFFIIIFIFSASIGIDILGYNITALIISIICLLITISMTKFSKK
ncbi:MAG: hypothetical protein LN567_07275 [Rickettsia endosymbiont of Graphium doson]|nr:hypothetical protein [Rickettsia endosymbiont of Graphium doson]